MFSVVVGIVAATDCKESTFCTASLLSSVFTTAEPAIVFSNSKDSGARQTLSSQV